MQVILLVAVALGGLVWTANGQPDIGLELQALSDKLENFGNTLSTAIENVKDELDSVGNEIDQVGNEIDNLEDEVGGVKDKVGDVEDKVGDVEDKVGDVDDKIGDVEDELDDLKAEVLRLRSEFQSGLEDLRTQLEGDLAGIKNECKHPGDGATAELAALRIDMQRNTEMIQQLQDQLNATLYMLQSRLTDTAHQAYYERVEIKDTVTQVNTLAESAMQLEDESRISCPGVFPSSCSDLAELGASSGYFWVSASATKAVQVYCDMERHCCGNTGGWIRVADLNMTDPSQQCPQGFRLKTGPKRVCERLVTSGCTSITFPTHGVQYSRVCGQVRAYQYGEPEAFGPYYNHAGTFEGSYVDGISITYGSPREHIWTLAAAKDEVHSQQSVCPCTKTDSPYTGRVPPFIGTDYFCETGSREHYESERFYHEDPLWDGEGCGPTSSCCQFNSPPWFCKELPQPTTDDIEVRVCVNEAPSDEDILFELIELYVQ